MKQEIEVKFLDVDFDDVRANLKKLGAVCEQPMRVMQRVIMDTPDYALRQKGGYIRIRNEGNKTTLTYKQFDKNKDLHIASASEIEVVIDDMESTVQLFEQVGFIIRSRQETKRETWKLDDVEIVLDEWPWLKPYIEIEAELEDEVKKVAGGLGFDWSKAVFGDVMVAYRVQYPHLQPHQTVGRVARVAFDQPMPKILRNDNDGN